MSKEKHGTETEDVKVLSGAFDESLASTGPIDHTQVQYHRKLKTRHINLIAISGTIGTAIFVSIGSPLTSGGPLSLLLGYMVICLMMWCINEGQAELVCQTPIESEFVRLASRYIDESVGVAQGYAYFVAWFALVCFEIVAFVTVIEFWGPLGTAAKAGISIGMLICYGFLNLWNVKYFGELEFWSGLWKIVLITGLILMTFVLMVGGNPDHRAFGFEYWRNPGPMAEFIRKGALGRFEGFLQCVIYASFSVGGPDVLSLAAGEAILPRRTMRFAFKSVMVRLVLIYIVGALAVGIIVPYNDPHLLRAIANGDSGAARSPYVIGMQLVGVKTLPNIVNALILTSIFSSGNACTFCASRALYGLAVQGQAPKVFARRNRNGIPYVAVVVVLCLGLLSLLQLSNNSNKVLNWLTNIVAGEQLILWAVMSVTYLRWRKAMRVQGFSRDQLPFRSKVQPYAAWFALILSTIVLLINGYTVFVPGYWDTETFIFAYFMIPFFIVVAGLYKIIFKTKLRRTATMDLIGERPLIDAYEAQLLEEIAEKKALGLELEKQRGPAGSAIGLVRRVATKKLLLWVG